MATATDAVLYLKSMKTMNENGVADVTLLPHPGGWLDFGYNATPDNEERSR